MYPGTMSDRARHIKMKATGEVVLHPMAHSLVSRGFAEWADAPAPKKKRGRPRKKVEPVPEVETSDVPPTDLSGAAPEGQDAENAENEPPELL